MIPANAFSNLSTINNKQQTLQHISLIIVFITLDPQTFNDIESSVRYLPLGLNNLTYLPECLSNLMVLHSLYLIENPMAYLDMNITSNIDRTLKYYSIDIDHFFFFQVSCMI